MKFPVNTVFKINDREWTVEEYRLGRGREWVYTLSSEGNAEDNPKIMRLNETAIKNITTLRNNSFKEIAKEEEVFA